MNRFARTEVRLGIWMLALAVLIGVSGSWNAGLLAQEDEPAEAAGNQGAVDEATETGDDPAAADGQDSLGRIVWKSIQNNWFGLTFYIVLALFSIAAMAVALERLVNLRRAKVVPERFVRGLRDLLGRNEGTVENLRRLSGSSSSPIASILKAGLVRAGRPLPEVEKAMEDAAAREMAAMRARNRPLSVIGNVAPLVGLLGTVVGMIFAFKISSQAGLGKAELLAEGIYLALLTTAAGLTIAIPCLLLVAWFNALVERFVREIDETLIETMPSFARMDQNSAVPTTVGSEPEPAAAGQL